ncbi:MAG TPA: hypothetical protein VFR84_15785 [Candidatus Angelobacter sp.]|nr:hypothetical protein [Candidatus Angelobacter sp.]
MTNQEIIRTIKACAKKLGRNPRMRDIRPILKVSREFIAARFGTFGRALKAAGLEIRGAGFAISTPSLLLDWATVARKLHRLPTRDEYTEHGKHSRGPFRHRFEQWPRIKDEFRNFARRRNIAAEWQDVLDLIARPEKDGRRKSDRGRKSPPLPGRPVYGAPIVLLPGMAHAPTNEAGVLFAFGALAPRLGFVVKRWQAVFPDCLAVREMAEGKWQDVNVELEMYSRNFRAHKHDAKKCDVIVCWEHNWPECPEWIEVIELRKVVEEMGNREIGKVSLRRQGDAEG